MRERPCSEGMGVHAAVVDPSDPLMEAVIERGMLLGHRFHVPTALEETSHIRFETSLKACPDGFQPWSDLPHDAVWLLTELDQEAPEGASVIRFYLDPNTPKNAESGCDVTVHDLLPPPRASTAWNMFDGWLKGSEAEKTGGYWCSLHDVAAAIARSLPFLKAAEGGLNIAGRRYWTAHDTHQEFMTLAIRSTAGKSGDFSLDHLAQHHDLPVTAVDVHAVDPGPERPPIGAFHRFLETHTGEGWRPIMPLRQSLMLVLADLLEEN